MLSLTSLPTTTCNQNNPSAPTRDITNIDTLLEVSDQLPSRSKFVETENSHHDPTLKETIPSAYDVESNSAYDASSVIDSSNVTHGSNSSLTNADSSIGYGSTDQYKSVNNVKPKKFNHNVTLSNHQKITKYQYEKFSIAQTRPRTEIEYKLNVYNNKNNSTEPTNFNFDLLDEKINNAIAHSLYCLNIKEEKTFLSNNNINNPNTITIKVVKEYITPLLDKHNELIQAIDIIKQTNSINNKTYNILNNTKFNGRLTDEKAQLKNLCNIMHTCEIISDNSKKNNEKVYMLNDEIKQIASSINTDGLYINDNHVYNIKEKVTKLKIIVDKFSDIWTNTTIDEIKSMIKDIVFTKYLFALIFDLFLQFLERKKYTCLKDSYKYLLIELVYYGLKFEEDTEFTTLIKDSNLNSRRLNFISNEEIMNLIMTRYPEIIQKPYMGRSNSCIEITCEQKSFIEKFRTHVDILRNGLEDNTKPNVLLYPSSFGGGKTTVTISTIDSMKCDDIIFVIVVPSNEIITNFIGNTLNKIVWCVSCEDERYPKIRIPYVSGKVPCYRHPRNGKLRYDMHASSLQYKDYSFLESYKIIIDYTSPGYNLVGGRNKYSAPNIIFCDINTANHLNSNRTDIESELNSKLLFTIDEFVAGGDLNIDISNNCLTQGYLKFFMNLPPVSIFLSASVNPKDFQECIMFKDVTEIDIVDTVASTNSFIQIESKDTHKPLCPFNRLLVDSFKQSVDSWNHLTFRHFSPHIMKYLVDWLSKQDGIDNDNMPKLIDLSSPTLFLAYIEKLVKYCGTLSDEQKEELINMEFPFELSDNFNRKLILITSLIEKGILNYQKSSNMGVTVSKLDEAIKKDQQFKDKNIERLEEKINNLKKELIGDRINRQEVIGNGPTIEDHKAELNQLKNNKERYGTIQFNTYFGEVRFNSDWIKKYVKNKATTKVLTSDQLMIATCGIEGLYFFDEFLDCAYGNENVNKDESLQPKIIHKSNTILYDINRMFGLNIPDLDCVELNDIEKIIGLDTFLQASGRAGRSRINTPVVRLIIYDDLLEVFRNNGSSSLNRMSQEFKKLQVASEESAMTSEAINEKASSEESAMTSEAINEKAYIGDKSNIPCKFKRIHGSCRNNNCPYEHSIRIVNIPCNFERMHGSCRNNNCPYGHSTRIVNVQSEVTNEDDEDNWNIIVEKFYEEYNDNLHEKLQKHPEHPEYEKCQIYNDIQDESW